MAVPDTQLYLAQMLDNIERIRLWTNGHTLPEEVKATKPHIPWRKVADIGNVLRHEYDDVADAEVWRIVVDDLSTLRSAVQSMIDES